MTMGPWNDQITILKQAPSKAEIAGLEAKVASQARFRDIEGAFSVPAVARRIRNEEIAGILVLIGVAAGAFILFFVLT